LAFNNNRPKEGSGERSVGGDEINGGFVREDAEEDVGDCAKSQILAKFEETYLPDVAKLVLQVEDKSDNRT
jgi:hypothetical protein